MAKLPNADRSMRAGALAALLAAAAIAAPGLASAQTTGTRLPTHPPATVVDGITVVGAIDDGSADNGGEEPADAAIAEMPAIYDDEPVATAPAAPAAPAQ